MSDFINVSKSSLHVASTTSVVQLLSHVWLFATTWNAARQASLAFTISRSLLKLMSIESVMPSNHLILCHLLLFLTSVFPSIRVFSNELAVFHNKWPKYWSFSLNVSSSKEHSELIYFRIDWFDLLVVQRTLKSLLQHIKRLHTYNETKHHPRANKFQSKTYHANSPAIQEHSPELQYTRLPKVTPKPLTSHTSLLDTSLQSREKKSSSTHQNADTSFPNQETLTSHWYNPTHSEETP